MLLEAWWSLGSDETCQAFRRVCETEHLSLFATILNATQGASGIHLEDQLHGGKKVRVPLHNTVCSTNRE